ncbi:MAG: hypothetical protein HY554_16890 [Elusimicrobia bacterium]|nr:hypothetical protein [Elusimicrobiota bacterium]
MMRLGLAVLLLADCCNVAQAGFDLSGSTTTKKLVADLTEVVEAGPEGAGGLFDRLFDGAVRHETQAAAVPGALAEGAPEPAPKLPSRFGIEERSFSWFPAYDLKAAGKTFGSVSERAGFLSSELVYKDSAGKLVSKGATRLDGWGVTTQVTDSRGAAVGAIRQELGPWLLPSYKVTGADGGALAASKRQGLFSTTFALDDAAGKTVLEIKPRLWLGFLVVPGRFDVRVVNPDALDSRLVVMMAAQRSAEERQSRERKREQEQDRKRRDSASVRALSDAP